MGGFPKGDDVVAKSGRRDVVHGKFVEFRKEMFGDTLKKNFKFRGGLGIVDMVDDVSGEVAVGGAWPRLGMLQSIHDSIIIVSVIGVVHGVVVGGVF